MLKDERNSSLYFPGKPVSKAGASTAPLHLSGTGIWSSYFSSVSDFVPGDRSCKSKPIVSMSTEMVKPGLYSWCPWSIKPWRNDDVPDHLWKPENETLKSFLEPTRKEASRLVQKYYHFHPNIVQRADEVNPLNATTKTCLAVHLRNSDKGKNKYRSKFPVNKFRDYINGKSLLALFPWS